MSSFKKQDGNWRIVGDVTMHPEKHYSEDGALIVESGEGVLLNINDDKIRSHLITDWEHGDIEISFDVMLPKGSNSGFYLHGRYELQLFDSWGVANPSFSDMGGIYRNWQEAPGQKYMGKAPLTNAAKAPGLWQHVHLLFRAPKFDDAGNKIANAKLDFVNLNGQRIHTNLEIPLASGAPISRKEVPFAPIMIQGDHGPVAFKNIRYKMLEEVDISLQNTRFKAYKGNFKTLADFENKAPDIEGNASEIDITLSELENGFALIFDGQVVVPKDDTYTFTLGYNGGIVFEVDGNRLLDLQTTAAGQRDEDIQLSAGAHTFKLYHYKTQGWRAPRLALFAKTANSFPVALHAYESYPQSDDLPSPIIDEVGAEPRLLRAFVDFYEDNQQTRLSHTVGVGDPTGVHYVYDLNTANVVSAWKGDFVDATPMWNSRGNGSFRPMGAAIYTFLNQPLTVFNGKEMAFSTLGDRDYFRPMGYRLDAQTKQPIFRYLINGVEVEHQVKPQAFTHLSNTLTIAEPISQAFYKLADGKQVIRISEKLFLIKDKAYYIKLTSDAAAQTRKVEGKTELFAEISSEALTWDVIW